MSSHTMQAVYLACDGCRAEIGVDGRYRSAMEARAGAYAEGWRFPNALRKNGTPSQNTHDVCPTCIGEWQPREYVATDRQYRRPEAGSA